MTERRDSKPKIDSRKQGNELADMIFDTEIKKDEAGRFTVIEVPFSAREAFGKPKGTIWVHGTINDIAYRGKLLARGGGRFVMVLDKAMQKSIGFDGKPMSAHITMRSDEADVCRRDIGEPPAAACKMDVMTAIKTRQSIRKFTFEPVSEDMIHTILSAGLCAPSAKDKRPCHLLVVKDRQVLSELAGSNSNAAMLESASCAIVVCGDRNAEGMKEFLYADCAAAAQNMLLCIHGLGLGGVWCGVAAHSDWHKLMAVRFELPPRLETVAVIAVGWPDERKELPDRWEPEKIHYDRW